MNIKISFIFLVFFAFVACKNESKKETSDSISTLEKAVEKAPNGENISKLLAEYNKVILDKETHRDERKEMLDKAYKLTTDQNWEKEMIGITSTYLKEFPADPANEEKLMRLIHAMANRNQKVTVNALKVSFLEAYPESVYRDSIRSTLDSSIVDTESYLDALADRIGDEESPSGLDIINAREYVNATEAMALVLPSKIQTPNYLFFAAEVSRNIKTFDKTLYLYDWIIEKYPEYERAPSALFMKGFILENELHNLEKAREVYREFLEKYPAHDLADDVQFLYDNLGKSNEEILEMIEKKKTEGE